MLKRIRIPIRTAALEIFTLKNFTDIKAVSLEIYECPAELSSKFVRLMAATAAFYSASALAICHRLGYTAAQIHTRTVR
jgi:hypothetical protein